MKNINKRLIKLEHYKIQRERVRARSWSEHQDV
jgi:hypothetical protein